jgi:ketosteroid isomerase-like protein
MRSISVRRLSRMEAEFALKFAEEWEAAWNSHDVERILTHYTDDVVFQSPYVVHRFEEPIGEVRGKDALRSYWGTGLEQQPDLHFTVEDIRVSVDTLVVNYRNHLGHGVSEVLRFRGDMVSWGCGAYVPGQSLAATRTLER